MNENTIEENAAAVTEAALATTGDEDATALAGRLQELETNIERARNVWIDAGRAMREIRYKRLYRYSKDGQYRTFEDYCKERWAFKASRARQLIAAVETLDAMVEATDVTTVTHLFPELPTERAIRPLVGLREDKSRLAAALQSIHEKYPPGSANRAPSDIIAFEADRELEKSRRAKTRASRKQQRERRNGPTAPRKSTPTGPAAHAPEQPKDGERLNAILWRVAALADEVQEFTVTEGRPLSDYVIPDFDHEKLDVLSDFLTELREALDNQR